MSGALHELIEQQAARTPDQTALVFEQQSLTYAEMNRRADRLADHLRTLGAGSNVLVGLFVERSVEMIVGILGVLKSGAAYVPIDPAYPKDRVAFMLSDANVGVLITQESLLSNVPSGAFQVLDIDSFDWSPSEETARSDRPVQPSDLAYVIYTSGSTGHPKGVCIEHRNIVNYVAGIAERLQLEPGMSHATVSTIAADLGNTVIFPALVTGGCLHVISQERAEDGAMLAEYFEREHIDVLKIVPSHLAALQSADHPERLMPKRRLIVGGEPSRLDWIARLRALSPGCEIYNHYGPTETTVGVMTYHVGPEVARTQSATLPLGKALPNTIIHILDAERRPTPSGEIGELYIGGAGVAQGYLNRPDLTEQKFGTDQGARMYRTGDLARLLPDGNIEFCGRADDQVKLNGYRVELGEIESTLREVTGIRDAVVLARENEAGQKQLVAYVVPGRAKQPLWDVKSVHVLPDGTPVAHLNKNETDYIYNEIFILQAYLRHGITVRDGDCVLDAGANIGLFSVFMSRLARDLRLVSFEPNPAAFRCLEANAQAWGSDATKCLPIGLSSESGTGELTFFEGLSLLSGFYADAATEREVVKNYVINQEPSSVHDPNMEAEIEGMIDDRLRATAVTAQLRTLSSVIAEEGIDRIDLLKINVEKSELDVLLGLNRDDWSKIRQLVIEVDRQEHVEPITALLKREGFDVLVEQDPLLRKTELCYVYAIRESDPTARLIREQSDGAHVRTLRSAIDGPLTPSTLRRHLREKLPKYMVPSAFVLLEKIPLTANGKIDRHALPAFSHENAPSERDAVGPRTETEKALAGIWSELLRIDNISANDDFFDLGGHSLMAMKAMSRIRDIFDVNLALRNLIESPTLSGLAEVIDGMSWVAKSDSPVQVGGAREEVQL